MTGNEQVGAKQRSMAGFEPETFTFMFGVLNSESLESTSHINLFTTVKNSREPQPFEECDNCHYYYYFK